MKSWSKSWMEFLIKGDNMKRIKQVTKTIFVTVMVMCMTMTRVYAADQMAYSVQPRYNNVASAALTIGFDTNNVVYCCITVNQYSHGTGVSGIMKLFDSAGKCLAVWSVSDYEDPIGTENTYQGVYGETYTCTFFGYAYSNNQTPPDELDMSVTGTCVDAD